MSNSGLSKISTTYSCEIYPNARCVKADNAREESEAKVKETKPYDSWPGNNQGPSSEGASTRDATLSSDSIAMEVPARTDPQGPPHQVGKGAWESFLPERPLRVLLVEDDHATRHVVCALLHKCGYEVASAANGLQAWELMENPENQFDLVLADAFLPVFSGTDLLAKIMRSEVHKDTPVIMMSSQDSMDMVFKCLLRGAKDFLVKPLRKNELRNLWQHVWRKHRISLQSSRSGSGSGSGSGSDSGMKTGKRREITRTSGSGNENGFLKDDTSGSSDKNAGGGSDNGSATQSLWSAPETAESLPCTDLAMQQVQPQEVRKAEKLQMQGNSLQDLDMGQNSVEDKAYGEELGKLTHRDDIQSNSEASEDSERSAKAIDLIGTMTAESRQGKDDWEGSRGEELTLCMGEGTRSKMSQSLLLDSRPLPALELTLRRPCANEVAMCEADIRKGLRRSAFSRYNNSAVVQQRQCIAANGSLPSDQCPLPGGFGGCSIANGDGVGSVNNVATAHAMPNDRTGGSGSSGSSTLHYPQAIAFHAGRQEGNSNLSSMASRRDHDAMQTKQERNLASLQSPWPNTPATIPVSPQEILSFGNGQTGRYSAQIHPSYISTPLVSPWSTRRSQIAEKEVCNHCDKDLEHQIQYHSHYQPDHTPRSEAALLASNQDQDIISQSRMGIPQCTSSEVPIERSAESGSTLCNISGSTKVSLNASASGSNEGSNFLSSNQNGQALNPTSKQDGSSFGDIVNTDEDSAMNCNGFASSDGGEVHSTMLLPDQCRSALREAALNKFRQKRKIRCFDKKVRYQSRKKLAEQRPRVKGQFVRQAVYDAAIGKPNKVEWDLVDTSSLVPGVL